MRRRLEMGLATGAIVLVALTAAMKPGKAAPNARTAAKPAARVPAAASTAPAAAPGSPARKLPPAPALRSDDQATRCAACHVVGGWEKVRFNHDPTGFPLRGGHEAVACAACHASGFDVPVPDTCGGCHRDRHAGEFGVTCEGCHDDRSWRPLFDADAHRRTNFPLTGKHGLIPCQQCHGDLRDRSFGRAAVTCVACHRSDFDATRVSSIDHASAGFSLECQTCHNTQRFWPARLPQHGACFRIASGSHHGIRCLGCHTSLGAGATFSGACATGTFTCSACHAHACPKSDAQHKDVMGYQCSDPKCYECHKITGQ